MRSATRAENMKAGLGWSGSGEASGWCMRRLTVSATWDDGQQRWKKRQKRMTMIMLDIRSQDEADGMVVRLRHCSAVVDTYILY